MAQEQEPVKMAGVIQVDEKPIQDHVGQMVRATVEETLNQLLDAEADRLCGARRYERSPDRLDTRAGSYERQLETKAGEVTLRVPKLRTVPFESAIIDRYRRRESSVEEALVEMYLAGVSVRRSFHLPTSVKPNSAPRARSLSRANSRQTTRLPGGGSWARAR